MPCSTVLLATLIVGPSFAADVAPASQYQKQSAGSYADTGKSYQKQYAGSYMDAGKAYQKRYAGAYAGSYMPQGGNYQQQYAGKYMSQYSEAYAGQNGAWSPNVENTSDWRSWRQAYMKVYAGAYTDMVHSAETLPEGPEHLSECHTVEDLKQWRARQTAEINAFTPIEYQNTSKAGLEATYSQRKAQMEANASASVAPALFVALPEDKSAASHNQRQMADADSSQSYSRAYAAEYLPHVKNASNPKDWRDAFMNAYSHAYMHFVTDDADISSRFPDAPAHADDCKNVKQLRQWRDASKARLRAFVPKAYQDSALDGVDKKFAKHKADLEEAESAPAPGASSLTSATLAHGSYGVPLMMMCMVSVAIASTTRRWWVSKSNGADVYLLHSEGPAVV